MAKLFNILKKDQIKTLILVTLFMVLCSPAAYAESVPSCDSIPAGSASCVCRSGFMGIGKIVCSAGQACEHTSTINNDGTVTNAKRCVNINTAKNTDDIGMQTTHIRSSDTYKYSGNNSCSTSCVPKCFYKEIKQCTFCGMFTVAFNTASKLAYHSIETFSGSIIKVVIMIFAIWIAITILTFVSTPETRDFKDLAMSIIQQSFYVILVVVLLETGGMSFFNLALEPVFNTGTTIAQKTISSQDIAKAASDPDAQVTCPTIAGSGIITQAQGGALPPSMGQSIICTMTLVQARAAKIKALGSSAICYSWEKKTFIIPHLGYLLTGIGLWIGAMILIIAVPFLMLDAVVELAVAAALIPMAIGAYAFKITRKYTKPVWETFLNSMFAFIFICLIALMLTVAFEQILKDSTPVSVDDLIRNGFNADIEAFFKDFVWWSLAFLKVCFVLILTFTVMSEAKDFAGQFSGSMVNTSIGSSIGTMGGSFAKSASKKLFGRTAEAVADTSWNMTKSIGGGTVHGLRRARMNFQANKIRGRASNVTKGENGSETFTDKSGNSVTYAADGSKTITTVKSKTRHWFWGAKRGTKTVTKQKNEHFSVAHTEIRNKNNEVTKKEERVRLNSGEVKNIFNRNGTVNEEVYNSLMKSGEGSPMEKAVKIAVAKEIAKQRMPNLNFNVENHEFETQELITENGEVVGYAETHKDGSRSEIRIKKGANNRMRVDFTQVNKMGHGRRLSSDGVINRKQTFSTEDGLVNGAIDEETLQTAYSLDDYYEKYQNRRDYKKVAYDESMFGEEEVKTAKQYINAHHSYQGSGMYEFRRR